jgi:hypothetical protein
MFLVENIVQGKRKEFLAVENDSPNRIANATMTCYALTMVMPMQVNADADNASAMQEEC